MILHIASGATWRAATHDGTYRGANGGDPFIHCSTGRQVRGPWRTLFAETPDLVMLLIDETLLEAPVRYETAGAGEDAFPHIYGPIPVAAVVATQSIAPGMATALSLPAPMARLVAAAHGNSPQGVDEWRHLHYTVSTDRALVLPPHRGRGLGVWLVQCAVEHPELCGLRSWQLATRDAHVIYERLGWRAADPVRWMARGVTRSIFTVRLRRRRRSQSQPRRLKKISCVTIEIAITATQTPKAMGLPI